MATRPHRACLRCGNIRKVSHRTLCRPCSVTAAQKGTLNDYPPIDMPQRTLQDFAEDFKILEARGLDYLAICRTMGYSTTNRGAALRVLIVRAQRAKLLPAGTPLCGWAPRKTLV